MKKIIIKGSRYSGKTQLAYTHIENCIDDEYKHTFPDNYPDFHFLKGGNVEDVKELLRKLSKKGFYKEHFVLLDNIDEMTREAQSLLLKVIEEKEIMFVITTNDVNRTLPTIFSRCVVEKTKVYSKREVYNYLFEKHKDKEYLKEISKLANGSIGRGIKYLEDENIYEFIKSMLNKEVNALKISVALEKDLENLFEYLFIIESLLKEKCKKRKKIKEKNKIFELILKIEKNKKNLKNNSNKKIILRNILFEYTEI